MGKIVLGIETSCDETSASIVKGNTKSNFKSEILSLIIHSQDHTKFGGVIPEFAARSHLTSISSIVDQSLKEARLDFKDIDSIAVTNGPGLMGGLVVGLMYAKGLSIAKKKPFLGVNHLEGHILTPRLSNNIEFPYLAVLVSGGHCQIIEVKSLGDYKILSQTLDDSIGEVFDKVARLLDLQYPGGPHIESIAKSGDENRFKFTIPMQGRDDMSFSGLKNALRVLIQGFDGNLTYDDKCDVAASFQSIISKSLIYSLKKAVKKTEAKTIVIVGGVASNMYLRKHINNFALENGLKFICPEPKLCTDNAAMIAWVGIEYFYKYSNVNVGINH